MELRNNSFSKPISFYFSFIGFFTLFSLMIIDASINISEMVIYGLSGSIYIYFNIEFGRIIFQLISLICIVIMLQVLKKKLNYENKSILTLAQILIPSSIIGLIPILTQIFVYDQYIALDQLIYKLFIGGLIASNLIIGVSLFCIGLYVKKAFAKERKKSKTLITSYVLLGLLIAEIILYLLVVFTGNFTEQFHIILYLVFYGLEILLGVIALVVTFFTFHEINQLIIPKESVLEVEERKIRKYRNIGVVPVLIILNLISMMWGFVFFGFGEGSAFLEAFLSSLVFYVAWIVIGFLAGLIPYYKDYHIFASISNVGAIIVIAYFYWWGLGCYQCSIYADIYVDLLLVLSGLFSFIFAFLGFKLNKRIVSRKEKKALEFT